MLLFPHAKINLSLDVLGRRPDGYHELRSVMQTVSLADELELDPAPELSLAVEPDWLGGPDNLVLRAAAALRRQSGTTGGARMRLRKRVPIAAGLGGGSSDAAATLWGLNTLWSLRLSRAVLAQVGSTVGSDVPFFMWGGTALVAGRGEQVVPLPDVPALPLVLVKPPIAVSTAEVFGALTSADHARGTATTALIAALEAPPATWPLSNGLQATTCRLYPVVEEVLASLARTGAHNVLMSGSGPTCFGFYATHAAAAGAAAALRAQGWEAWAALTVPAAALDTARELPLA